MRLGRVEADGRPDTAAVHLEVHAEAVNQHGARADDDEHTDRDDLEQASD